MRLLGGTPHIYYSTWVLGFSKSIQLETRVQCIISSIYINYFSWIFQKSAFVQESPVIFNCLFPLCFPIPVVLAVQTVMYVQLGYSGNVMAKLFMPLLKRSICVCRNAAQTESLSLYCHETVLYITVCTASTTTTGMGKQRGKRQLNMTGESCRLLKYSWENN